MSEDAPPLPPPIRLTPEEIEQRIAASPAGTPPSTEETGLLVEQIARQPEIVRARLIKVAAKRFREPIHAWRSAVNNALRVLRGGPAGTGAGTGEAPPGVPVAERLPDFAATGAPPTLICPPNYSINPATGAVICHGRDEEAVVSPAPVLVVERIHVHDENVWKLDIASRLNNAWKHTVEEKSILYDARKIVSLAAKDMPVTSDNARALVKYLAAMEIANIHTLPSKRVVTKCGWHSVDGERVFVLGDRTFTAGGPTELLRVDTSNGEEHFLAALEESGTWEGWVEALRPVFRYPKIRLAVYAALSAPLVEICQAPNPILDFCGPSSKGKTTAAQIAASVWGFPGGPGMPGRFGLVQPWNSTRVFRERLAALLSDLPVILDDSQTANQKDLASTVYDIANGIGRGRGAIKGMNPPRRWNTVMISTGETPLSSTVQFAGIKVRAPELWGDVFDNAEAARAAKSAFARHYGHAGPRFVAAALRWLSGDKDILKNIYVSCRDELLERTPAELRGELGDRIAESFGLFRVAAELLHHEIGVGTWLADESSERIGDFIAGEYRALLSGADLRQSDEAAYETVMAWIAANAAKFRGNPEARNFAPNDGWYGVWIINTREHGQCVAVAPHMLERFLRDEGYDPAAILRAWREKGWLVPDHDKKQLRRLVKVEGILDRYYVLKRIHPVEGREEAAAGTDVAESIF